MQSHDSSRSRSPKPSPHSAPPPAWDTAAAAPAPAGLAPAMPFAQSRVVVAAPALLIEAHFRGVPLASRLLRADAPQTFTVGAARGADAPVNPAYLGGTGETTGYPLVEPMPGGFAVNLAPAMSAELLTPGQVLPLRPDFGHAEAPLMLPADACLRVSCGEVAFDLFAAEPAAVVERPGFIATLRGYGRYEAGAVIALLALLLVAQAIPPDPRSLSLEDLKRDRGLPGFVTIPLEVNSPEIDAARAVDRKPGGGGAPAAKGDPGQAGDKKAKPSNGRRAVAGQVQPKDARDVLGEIRQNSILAYLDGPRRGALGAVMDDKPALGPDAKDVLGHLQGTEIATAYGTGLGPLGTGEGGGGTGERTLSTGGLGTIGLGTGRGPGGGPGIGYGVGQLGTRRAKAPDIVIGSATVRGSLDKEIIRRTVRRHLNEVKYCYDQALVRQPKLDGRLVAQFTIAGNGQVLASVVQSSTLGSLTVEKCVVDAIKRWQFPAPEKGGLAIVSYPFQFSPAGN